MSKYWKNFLITVAIAGVTTVTILLSKNAFAQTEMQELMKIFCDSFFVSGSLLTCVGLLVYCSSKGAFLAFRYLIHTALVNHNWSRTKFKDRKTYREYREEKLANPHEVPSYILHVGLIFVAISLIFLIAYYMV